MKKFIYLFVAVLILLFATGASAFSPEEGMYSLEFASIPDCQSESCVIPTPADFVDITVNGHTVSSVKYIEVEGELYPCGEQEYSLYGRFAYIPGVTEYMDLSGFGLDAVIESISGPIFITWFTDEIYGYYASEGSTSCSGTQCAEAGAMMGVDFPAIVLPVLSFYQLE